MFHNNLNIKLALPVLLKNPISTHNNNFN